VNTIFSYSIVDAPHAFLSHAPNNSRSLNRKFQFSGKAEPQSGQAGKTAITAHLAYEAAICDQREAVETGYSEMRFDHALFDLSGENIGNRYQVLRTIEIAYSAWQSGHRDFIEPTKFEYVPDHQVGFCHVLLERCAAWRQKPHTEKARNNMLAKGKYR
jgi:hypothetical protein